MMKPELKTQNLKLKAHPGLIAVAGLGILILAAFGDSRTYALLKFDSERYILEDRAIRILDWEHIHHIFTTYYFINYNPLQRISYMVDWALWGTDPAGYRSTNFFLHWVAASFVFLFFYRLTNRAVVGWTTSLVFALHPTRVECVVWLAQRKDVLAAAFGFAALWFYLKSKDSGRKGEKAKRRKGEKEGVPTDLLTVNQQNERHGARDTEQGEEILNSQFSILNYGLCVVLVTCALASKAQWVPLCAVFIALDVYQRRSITWRVVVSYLPFFFLSALFAWFAIDAQLIVGKKGAGAVLTLWDRLANPLVGIGVYVTHTLWPVNLCPRYPETLSPNLTHVAVGTLTVVAALVGVWWSWSRNREFFLGAAWFVFFLAPILNLLPGRLPPADRYLYVAILGLIFPLGMFLSRKPLPIVMGVLCVLCLAMLVGTWRYLPAWKDDFSLWSYSTKFYPDDTFGLTALGKEQMERQDYAGAQRTFEHAAAQPMWFAPLVSSASRCAQLTGRDTVAILAQGLAQNRESPDVMAAYGDYYLEQKNYLEAEKWYVESIRRKRTFEVLQSLALVYENLNQPEKGIVVITSALQADIFNEKQWLILGKLHEQQGTLAEAEIAYRECVRLDPSLTEPCFRLASLAYQKEAINQAEAWLLEMRKRSGGKPMPAQALNLLAWVYRRQGKMFPALVALREAAQAEDSTPNWLKLARLEVEMGRNPRQSLNHILLRNPEKRSELIKDQQLGPFLSPE